MCNTHTHTNFHGNPVECTDPDCYTEFYSELDPDSNLNARDFIVTLVITVTLFISFALGYALGYALGN